ncbi:hypothetical protein [Halorarius halobius]|uniref:hypothetical protein n=1 Tax=Halorarius halobius TaxID=2962671 RepID=UPI0020CCD55D|nr:hypothetical protein [Halorarius halobius]
MARRSLSGSLGARSRDPPDRLARFVDGARAARRADDAALSTLADRVRGFGCPAGDMRLAYGWRAAVLTAAVVALLAGLVSRVLLTGLFVAYVTDGVVAVTAFNVGVTLVATLLVGLARAQRFRLGVYHRLAPVRRRLARRVARWRRAARLRRRHRRARLAYRCRRTVAAARERLRAVRRRHRHRRRRPGSALAAVLSLARFR